MDLYHLMRCSLSDTRLGIMLSLLLVGYGYVVNETKPVGKISFTIKKKKKVSLYYYSNNEKRKSLEIKK